MTMGVLQSVTTNKCMRSIVIPKLPVEFVEVFHGSTCEKALTTATPTLFMFIVFPTRAYAFFSRKKRLKLQVQVLHARGK